jgi:hypothetical protein
MHLNISVSALAHCQFIMLSLEKIYMNPLISEIDIKLWVMKIPSDEIPPPPPPQIE